MAIFQRAGVPRKLAPPFLPETAPDLAARTGNPPRITSPMNGHKILLTSAKTIPLQARADADVREIYWFAGRTFIGKTRPQDVLAWKVSAGSYELIALDDHGRSSSSAVTVQ
jgi:penicillin-binding protein 1C